MDLGLYNLKYPFRKMIGFLLPFCRNVDPNVVSWSLVPIGIVTACVYYYAPNVPWYYLMGAILIFIRMVVGTLDGLIAVEFDKESRDGEMINRVAPELADILLMLGLVYSVEAYHTLGVVAIALCWGVTFFGLIGLVAGRKIQSVGPVGQTDRIAALALFSVLQYVGNASQWGIDFIHLFLWWVVVGSLLTILLRFWRNLRSG